ncbi:hypothetical protein GCM10009784_08060 [Arthrobacter parietis]|uniref:HipA-like C-terminal domain-containing protein n=1 Tax=Arthrobacter parietis TaxID=271434 RepID=A0ABP5MKD2_9MICC
MRGTLQSIWPPDPSSLVSADFLPLTLKGRYQKLLLRNHESQFLFKSYGVGDGPAKAAEIAAADILQILDRERSVPVAEFTWEELSGTIQPYLADAHVISLSNICDDDSLLVKVLCRQVADWTLSNHDAHINHVLWEGRRPFFVDYGQAYKFFPHDVLSTDYYPNVSRQLEPVYNALHRSRSLTAHQKAAVLSAAARMSSTFHDPVWELLRPFAVEKFDRIQDQEVFLVEVRKRVRDTEATFEAFLKERG